MRILVGGSLRQVPRDPGLCRDFVAALGTEIVKLGHVLVNGCRSSLDREIACAAGAWLVRDGRNPSDRIVSYCLRDVEPIHTVGTVRVSALSDWQMNHPELRVPEQIELAHATIFVAGAEGTFWAKNWAFYARKPILGIPRFGGAGETIYDHELSRLRSSSPEAAGDYETLNQLSSDFSRYAAQVVGLAERLVTPRTIFTIMPFRREFREVYSSYQEVCGEFGFTAERTDESASTERIIPRIEAGIRGCAFAIADVSEPSPNVFFETGFARALGKDVIMTARKGTNLPFDAGDIPVIFWEMQEDLKEALRKRLAGLLGKYGKTYSAASCGAAD
jgi:hypothetical protein